jgi:hypothetical protein
LLFEGALPHEVSYATVASDLWLSTPGVVDTIGQTVDISCQARHRRRKATRPRKEASSGSTGASDRMAFAIKKLTVEINHGPD